MAERSTIAQVVQAGVQTAVGTPATDNIAFGAVGFTLNPEVSTNLFTPSGGKYPVSASVGKDLTNLTLVGDPTYEEVLFPLAMCLGKPVFVVSGAKYTFTPAFSTADTIVALTLVKGDATTAEKVQDAVLSELSFNFTRDDVSMAGTGLARATAFASSLTGGATGYGATPLQAANTNVYLDTTGAGIGVTKLTRVLSASWRISNKLGALWVLDAAQTSYVALVEVQPTIELNIQVEANAAGVGLFGTYLRTGTKAFVRLENNSGAKKFYIDTACTFTGAGELTDQDGVYALSYTLAGTYDSTWTKTALVQVEGSIPTTSPFAGVV